MRRPLRRTIRRSLRPLLAIAAVALPSIAGAQRGGGDVRGVVTSLESGAPITSARVAVASPARVALSSERGAYVVRDLPAGRYEIVVTALGRKPRRDTVAVESGRATTHDVALGEGPLMLSSVIVSATRTPAPANVVASTVNVLTAEHIATSPARESQDLLREIPGVELPRTSSLVGGTAQIVSIRGVDEGRTVVLFDGIPVNDAWGEWIDWGRVPKGMLERVEVIEGGTSNLYGNGAMGGVISYFSRPLAPGAVVSMVEGGSRDLRHAFLSAGLPIAGPFSANVSGDYQDGGGYPLLDPDKRGDVDVASEIIQRNGYLRVNYAPSSRLSAFVTGHLFSDNRRTGTELSYQTRDQRHVDFGADVGTLGGGDLSLRAWTGRQDEHQRNSTVRAGRAAEDSSGVADIPSHDWGASAVWSRALWKLETLSVGADYRRMSGNYDEVSFSTACPGASCGNVTRTVFSGGEQSLSGAFVQAIAAPIAPLRIELGARVDGWSNADAKSVDATAGTTTYPDRHRAAFSPRVGARYSIRPSLSLHGAVYHAFRAPNLAELFRKQVTPTTITLPNPDLAAETALGREVGLNWEPLSWLQLKGTWYAADYRDFNVPVQIASGPPAVRQRLNVSRSRSQGGEAYLALRPLASLFVAGSVNYDDARVVSGPPGTTVGAHINRVPSPRQTVRTSYLSPRFGDYTVIWRHEGHTTTLQGASLEPYSQWDANLRRGIVPGLLGFVSVENIGDVQYQINIAGSGAAALVSYGMPRTIRVGIEATR